MIQSIWYQNFMATQKNSNKKPKKGNFRFPSMPNYWENFFVSIIFILILPLLPIFIEWYKNGNVNGASLALSASMYTISIGITSRSRLIFALTIFASIIYAIIYGSTLNIPNEIYPKDTFTASTLGIIFTFIVHAIERYNKHIADRTPFWEFMQD